MPHKTPIEWTNYSWNPIRARDRDTGKIGWFCEHVSEGCRHCYSENINHRLGTGIDFARQNRNRVEVFLDEKVLRAKMPLPGSMIFVCDMTDLFGEFVLDEWIGDIFRVIADNPTVTFQILTKRPERMRSFFAARKMRLNNVWLGTSVESRRELWRLDQLRTTPAVVHFVSFEPLLEDLGDIDLTAIDWAITGAESGAGARPMLIDWVRGLRDQCIASGVPFFFKQDARNGRKIPLPVLDGRQWREFPRLSNMAAQPVSNTRSQLDLFGSA
jgi:protein gp37